MKSRSDFSTLTAPAPIAQLDRASDYGSGGWGFKSSWAHQEILAPRALPAGSSRLELSVPPSVEIAVISKVAAIRGGSMSKKTKIIIGAAVVLGLGAILAFSLSGQGPQPAEGHHREGREGRPRRQGHRQRKDPGAPEGGPLGAGHGADRQPRGQGRGPRQAGAAAAPDRQGAARRRGRRGARRRSPPCGTTSTPPRRTPSRRSSTIERAKGNFDAKILSEAEYQKAKSALDTAQATLAATEQRMNEAVANLAGSRDSLSKTTVTAPIDGIVTALPVKEGEVTVIGTMNNPGTQLLTISDMARGRSRHDGGRDFRAPGQDRPDGYAFDRRLPGQDLPGPRDGSRLLADPEERSGPALARPRAPRRSTSR